MDIPVKLQQQLNAAISEAHQSGEPLRSAQRAGALITYLQGAIEQLAQLRREAIAEAVQWPGESMATVAAKLNLSKSAVAKLATPDIREIVATDLRARLARGFNPPPAPHQSSRKQHS